MYNVKSYALHKKLIKQCDREISKSKRISLDRVPQRRFLGFDVSVVFVENEGLYKCIHSSL